MNAFIPFGRILTRFTFLILLPLTLSCSPVPEADELSGGNRETMENRLRQLEDREAIRQLLLNYGRHLDRRDFDAFSMLFSEKEGEWIGGMGSAKGREAIRKFMIDKLGTNGGEATESSFHLFMNERIDLDGDHATAYTKWVFVIQNSEGRPVPFYLGHYEDLLVKEDEGWRFLRRVAYSDIPKDNPEP